MEKATSLYEIARKAMLARGFEADFSPAAVKQLESISGPAKNVSAERDLSRLLWCSIDNDDSRDLDQLTVAEALPNGRTKILIGIADVDALVKVGTPIDEHAKANTTTVYTGVRTFPMLPEKLSTNLTSLSENKVRRAVITEITVDRSGQIVDYDIYHAAVKNQAKLAYNSVSDWLEGNGPIPKAVALVSGMDGQLRLQDEIAQKMKKLRHKHGALELETIEPRPIMKDGVIVDLEHEKKNRARELIEDFMIASNGTVARYLFQKGFPSLRRVVRSPKRWDKIIAVARDLGENLPQAPEAEALSRFLSLRREKDPLRFPDLSLTIVKLLGRGEYVLEAPGQVAPGHFGLAVRDYTHSTAPNRRYPDVITQRLLKAALAGDKPPYENRELEFLANHCTEREDSADRVERQVRKSAAAMLLLPRIGEIFEGVVTGTSEKGTWARVFHPPVEGKIVQGFHGVDIGDRVRLKLMLADVERGFIDFARVY